MLRTTSSFADCVHRNRLLWTYFQGQQLDEVLKELETRAKESQMLRSELESLKVEVESSRVGYSQPARNRPLNDLGITVTSPGLIFIYLFSHTDTRVLRRHQDATLREIMMTDLFEDG